jgi:hypothetical protein
MVWMQAHPQTIQRNSYNINIQLSLKSKDKRVLNPD